jgi:Spy/CpxP family protein refolding chaperone
VTVARQWRLLAVIVPAMFALPQAGRAQAARQAPAWWESAWWNSPLVQNMDLSESQRRDIRMTVREYRGHLMDLREAIQRADADLDAVLNEKPVDQRKADEAIERLASARADMTRTLSQMTLRLRAILSDAQWQELQRRYEERRAGRAGAPGRAGRNGGATYSPDAAPQR